MVGPALDDWRSANLGVRTDAGLTLMEALCKQPVVVDQALLDELRRAGLDDAALIHLGELAIHFQFINRMADAFDFKAPTGSRRAKTARFLDLVGRRSGWARGARAVRGADGRLRPAELEAQRETLFEQGIELSAGKARAVATFVAASRRADDVDPGDLEAPLVVYLQKMARHAYRISDDEFAAARAVGGSDAYAYELTLVASFAAASVGVEELFEHMQLVSEPG